MDASLLDKEKSPPQASRSWKRLALGVCVLIGLGCSGTLLLCHSPGARFGIKRMKPTQIDEDYDYGGPECVKFTGGTCDVEGCNKERNSTCKGGYLSGGHYCACDSDLGQGCVGGDGNCRSEVTKYETVARHIRLRNVQFDDMYLYSPTEWYENQLRVDKKNGGDDEADRWTIYRVPGKIYNSNGTQTGYMIRNDKFPTYAAGVWSNKVLAQLKNIPKVGTALKVAGGLLFSPLEVRVVNVKDVQTDPTRLLQWICKNDDGSLSINGLNPDSASMAAWVNGLTQNSASWYIQDHAWEVFGYYYSDLGYDVGPGGYWSPEPPLSQDEMNRFEHCLKATKKSKPSV